MSNSNRSWKKAVSFAAATVMLMASTFTAFADDIANNIDASVDAVAETMSLNVGGSNGSTNLYVVPKNGDGKNGCNITGSTTLVVSVSSSNSSVATVSPTSITFSSCGDIKTLTVTPVGAGTTKISLSETTNTTSGTFDLAPATFNVVVAGPSNTAPSVTISGVTGGASYEIGSVPAATCNVTDAEDGNSSFAATLSAVTGPLAAYGLGSQTASCSYTDAGGLTASASKTYSIVDTGDPIITLFSRTPATSNTWNNGDVTVVWTCSDSGSGVVDTTVTEVVSTEGENQSVTGTCKDHAGNTAEDTVTGINIDKTAPTATATASPAPNGNGWNNTDVTVNFSGVDNIGGSGIDFCSADVVKNSEGAGQSASGTCTDKAGNVSDPASVSGINIDKTAPTINWSSSLPANGGIYYFEFVPPVPTCTTSDDLSGVATPDPCEVTGYAATIGSQTITANTKDKADNPASESRSFTVKAWTLSGFYQPVDMNGVLNTVKSGSTVPLKFEIFAGPTEITDTGAVKYISAVKAPCTGGLEDAVSTLSTSGSTALRYDSVAGQFIFNWQTPKNSAGVCYVVTMKTHDGSSITANFKLK